MLRGAGTSKGIGMGKAFLISSEDNEVETRLIDDVKGEIQKYNDAKEAFISEIEEMIKDLQNKLGNDDNTSMVLKNQIYLIKDVELNKGVEDIISTKKVCAQAAVDEMCRMYIKMFSSMDNDALKQRVADLEDVRGRMIGILSGSRKMELADIKPGTILVAKELHPSVTAAINTDNIAGIVSEKGGDTSHASILARALEIPAVLNVKDITSKIKENDFVIVDGGYGEVFVNPTECTINIYRKKRKQFLKKAEELKQYIKKETVTADGKMLCLAANIANSKDAAKAMEAGAEGIGLFRTEYLFMNRTSLPSEEEQFNAYKEAAVICGKKFLTVRTIDIGGDKNVPYLGLSKESNPFLGYRAIRFCLDRTDVFTTQIRAILRASAYGNIRIMLPLITCVNEVIEAKQIIASVMEQLDRQQIKYNKDIMTGIMIETPAASLMADVLAKEADFFSIGTNDLTQYTMAVDRGNENVAYLYSVFNPAVLRSIKRIIGCARENNIEVGMCGEAAGVEGMIPLLIAFGLDEFSVSASKTLETRKNIASWSVKEASELTDKVMEMCTEKEISNYINDYIAARNEKISGLEEKHG